jgi:hypothetical protein
MSFERRLLKEVKKQASKILQRRPFITGRERSSPKALRWSGYARSI